MQTKTSPRLIASSVLVFSLASLWLPSSAFAAFISLEATLDQSQEIPAPIAVPGATGTAVLLFDDVTSELSWGIAFSGLSGAATGMHFHGPAPAGSTAGLAVDIGALSGLTSPSIGSTSLTAGQTTELLDGLWYINVHTVLNPAGEIRGQVVRTDVIPAPGALALALAGMLSVSACRRWRQTRQ